MVCNRILLAYGNVCHLMVSIVCAVLQIIVGRHYKDNCPVNWHIPLYLVVAGVVGLVAHLLRVVKSIVEQGIKASVPHSARNAVFTLKTCSECGFGMINFSVELFLNVSFIAGCVWIFSVWRHVQYTNEEESTYCDPILYRFAYWFLLFPSLYLLSLVCVCFQCLHEAAEQKRKSSFNRLSTGGLWWNLFHSQLE